ncbi:MAG TPA: hypothetical protein VNX68_03005, partial [Nitrosopumilaceae archaeon]|nr:hypothetical protein [Nitrosopumilaceae archaeon]
MRKIYVLIIALSFSSFAKAQNAIPNGNFESWTSMTFDLPQYFVECSNYQAFYQCMCPANEVKTTDSYHNSFAVQLTTQTGPGKSNTGYFVNANTGSGGGPASWTGGVAY